MTSNPKWKRVERHLRDLLPNGKRNPSNGFAQADVENDYLTFEVKSRERASFPQWILKAFDQRKLNEVLQPEKMALNLFAVHFGRGNLTRFFIATEVVPKNPDFMQAVTDFIGVAGEIEDDGEATA